MQQLALQSFFEIFPRQCPQIGGDAHQGLHGRVQFADGAVGADVAFTLQASKDDAFIVVASGRRPMTPVLGAAGTHDEDAAAILPWAMTGAIWIDADGNGESLGRIASVAPSPGLRPPPSRQILLGGASQGPGAEPIQGGSRTGTDGGAL